jgi:hypothetical protein
LRGAWQLLRPFGISCSTELLFFLKECAASVRVFFPIAMRCDD